MTCGIYILKFKGTDQVYVGQSIHIEDRYKEHLTKLKHSKGSRRLQSAYDIYGIPELQIVLECPQEDLDACESEAINIYDSFNNGLNSVATSEETPKWRNLLKGEENPSAIYENKDILKVVKLMCDPTNTLVAISEITGVNYATVRKISQGVQHTWIKEEFPDLWDRMTAAKPERMKLIEEARWLNNQKLFNAKAQGIEYPKVISPDGTVYEIENLSDFCRKHNLQRTNFRNVLKGKRISCLGWKVFK
jgi:hypothetical protein